MNKILFFCGISLACFIASNSSFADLPSFDPVKDAKYGAAGRPVWGQTETIAAAGEFIPNETDAVVITQTAFDDAPKLFRYGTIVMITCDVDALAFFVHDTGVTTSTTGNVSDASSMSGRTSGANGIWLEAGVTRHVIVPVADVSGTAYVGSEGQVSVREKSCGGVTSNSTTARALDGRPCDAVADCFHGASPTCSTSNGLVYGSYLKIHPASGAAVCAIEIEH